MSGGNPSVLDPPDSAVSQAQADKTGSEVVRVGVIGYGYWGPNLVRNFAEAAGSQITMVSDVSADRLARASRRYPNLRITQDAHALLHDPSVDLVAIATPVTTHFELAMEALRAGKHVLVEKPLAATSEQGLRLIEEAERRRLLPQS